MRVPLTGCWGATETASAATMTAETNPRYDAIGAPLAGVELKLAPVAGGAEARVRGASVAHAYWWRSDLTAAAFDEEGYFRSGDRVRPVDARAPRRGLAFAGRLDDRFTLSSGESVDRAAVRATLLVECSDIADALVSGEGHDEIGVIVWPNAGGARLDPDVLRAQVLDALRRAGAGPSAATPPRRALIVDREPSSAERRALLVRLHASEPDAEVIVA
jgi:feruloyl-CoA synthase